MDSWTSYKAALAALHKHGKSLKATDFQPHRYVIINHEEGTTLIYASAFIVEWKDWIFVYTEHHGEMAFHKTDLRGYHNLISLEIQPLMGTGCKDKCEECGAEHLVEDLSYETHPDPDKWEEDHFVILCPSCLKKHCGEEEDGNLSSASDQI
jgi:hypothetical protein